MKYYYVNKKESIVIYKCNSSELFKYYNGLECWVKLPYLLKTTRDKRDMKEITLKTVRRVERYVYNKIIYSDMLKQIRINESSLGKEIL